MLEPLVGDRGEGEVERLEPRQPRQVRQAVAAHVGHTDSEPSEFAERCQVGQSGVGDRVAAHVEIAQPGQLRHVRQSSIRDPVAVAGIEPQFLEVRQAGQVSESGVGDRRGQENDVAEVFQAPQVRQSSASDFGIAKIERDEPVEIRDHGQVVVGRLVVETDRGHLLEIRVADLLPEPGRGPGCLIELVGIFA